MSATPILSLKTLATKSMKTTHKFMDEKVDIKKLTVAEVEEIQELAKSIKEDDQKSNMTVMKRVIKIGCIQGGDLEDEDFQSFPIDELANLSNAIMKFSGIAGDSGK